MALTGSMRDFGISEILQLIGHQKKSGVLAVKDKTRTVEITFNFGNIVEVRHEPPEEAFDLSAILIRSGLVERAKIAALKREQAQSLKPLEQILLNAQVLTVADLSSLLMLVQLEAIYSLFLWKDGDYSFEAKPVSYHHQWTTPISSEQVLMDGYRLKDEWPLIEKAIPDPLVQLERTEDPAPATWPSEQHQKVYAFVDGERTAEDLVFLSRLGRFETLKIVKELLEQKKVRTAGTVARPQRRDPKAVWFQAAALTVLAIAVLAGVVGFYRNGQRMFGPGLEDPDLLTWAKLWTLYQEDRVGQALSVYAARAGAYPGPGKLREDLGLKDSDLLTPWGELRYQPDAERRRCTLQAPAPPPRAGAPGTAATSQDR